MPDPDNLTLGEALAATAARLPGKTALIGAERSYTWAELDAEVTRVAGLWASMGIGHGDVVGMCTSKRPEVVVTFLALGRLGAIAAPVNFKLEPARLADQFETGGIRGLLLEDKLDDVAGPLLHHLGKRILYVGPRGRYAGRTWDDASGPMPSVTVSPRDPCYYNYTSGTTGRPKAAVATHANVLWNALSGVEGLGFAENDVFLGMFSVFSHPHELFNRALLTGTTCVVFDTMSPRIVCELVQKHRITWMMAVPSFYEMMLEHGGGDFDLSSLRILESGGAWVSPDTLERLEARFGCGFMPVWGSTETNGVALAMRPDRPRRAGATGQPVARYEVGVFDDHGRPAPDGETGEMWVRGPAVSAGYVAMPDETARAFQDGWYKTSDLVRRDKEGFFHFVGRRHDMLKVGGIRVFPLEIEQVLLAHPAIAEAVVVRAEERVRGEVPRAILRVAPGHTLTGQEVRAFCREHLAVYKVPRIVELWESIPKLPNGKIDRKAVEATAPKEST
jgi:long-chain acyl-CoA synthetase